MVDEIRIERPPTDFAGEPYKLADQLVEIVNKQCDEGSQHQFALVSAELSRGEWATVVAALRRC